MSGVSRQRLSPGTLDEDYQQALARLEAADFERRLIELDPTLWPDPAAAGRLGWLRLPESMSEALPDLRVFAAAADNVGEVLLLGMGGSSLGAEMLASMLAAGDDRGLTVLDSTHPASVGAHLEAFDPATTLHLVASKSGSTVETRTFLRSFWHRHPVGDRFLALSDAGSELHAEAEAHQFRGVFATPSDVGGRFSVLSQFGLVPALRIGIDPEPLLAAAADGRARAGEALELGALLAAAAASGRNKVTFEAEPRLRSFLDWLEQLLAESTGKRGTGVVPVFDEPENAPPSPDRVRVAIGLGDASPGDAEVEHRWGGVESLGAEIMRWQIATAAAGWLLAVSPFDQPDVDRAKKFALEAVRGEAVAADSEVPTVDLGDDEALSRGLGGWLAEAAPGDYIALQVFLPAAAEVRATVASLRRDLAATGLPTTVGYGPRYLHSTGQLHKGGPRGVYCLQLIDGGGDDLEIPGVDYGYRQLIDAQSIGDARALRERGRSVLRVRIDA